MNAPVTQPQNLAQRVRLALRDDELSALDSLFQLACRRSERHLPGIRKFDWSRLPRSLEFGLADTRALDCDQAREAGRAFLSTAIDEMLEANGQARSELEVLRLMRLRLDGVPSQQLGEHLEDDAVLRRDPRTYRNWIVAYGYAQIRAWAHNGLGGAAVEPLPETLPDHRRSDAWPGWWRWAVAVIGLVAIAATVRLALSPDIGHPDTHAMRIPVTELGLNLPIHLDPGEVPRLGTAVPMDVLPNLGAGVTSATLIPKREALRQWPDAYAPLDSVLVALGTGWSGEHSGHVTLWDPATDAVLWEYEFTQRPGDAAMNADLPPDAGAEQYRVAALAHSSPFASLGPDRLIAVLSQRFSPTFVVMLDLRTGEELARYASYGSLYEPLVLDIDQDGDPEVLLSGTDNACDAATLTVLDPDMSDGATSSVGWNQEGEGALWRVILPDPRALFDDYFASYDIPYWPGAKPPRLHTYGLGTHSFDPASGRLVVGVGPAAEQFVYEATVVHGRPDFSVPVIRLGDSNELVWRSMGLDPATDVPRLASRVVVVEQGEGYACPEGMEKVERGR